MERIKTFTNKEAGVEATVSYQRTRLDAFGFPRGYLLCKKTVKGFQTGDMVVATVPSGKHAGTHIGRVAIRASGSFNLQMPGQVRQGISYKHCRIVQRNDGYKYERRRGASAPCLKVGVSALAS